MILIRIERDEAGRIAGFQARGHALFADRGTDVVCAGVSALLQTALLGLEKCAGAGPEWTVAHGKLRCALPPPARIGEIGRLCAVLLDSMLLGLREIDNRYPGYMRIEEKGPRRPATKKKGQEVSTK